MHDNKKCEKKIKFFTILHAEFFSQYNLWPHPSKQLNLHWFALLTYACSSVSQESQHWNLADDTRSPHINYEYNNYVVLGNTIPCSSCI